MSAKQIAEPFLTGDLEVEDGDYSEEGLRLWHAKALRTLARQLGLGNDYYYPLLGAARLLDGHTTRSAERELSAQKERS